MHSKKIAIITFLAAAIAPALAFADDSQQSDIQKFKAIARQKSLLEAQIKLQELKQKLSEVNKKQTDSSTPPSANSIPMPGKKLAPIGASNDTGNAIVTKITAYGDNATAMVKTDYTMAYYNVGDTIPSVGKIKSIDIKGVVACQGNKACKTIPYVANSLTITDSKPSSSQLPPPPPVPMPSFKQGN